MAQFVTIFICDSNAIQNFPDKERENDSEQEIKGMVWFSYHPSSVEKYVT